MPGTLLTANGQVQLGSDPSTALLCNPQHGSVTSVAQRQWAGHDFNPLGGIEIATFDVPLSHRHGVLAGVDVASTRRLEFTLWLAGSSDADLSAMLTKLHTVTRPGVGPLQELAFQALGKKYVMYGRYRGAENASPRLLGTRQLEMKIRFVATDPVIYECDIQTTSIFVYPGAMGTLTAQTQLGYTVAPYSVNKLNWTALTVGGTAPARWSILVPKHHRNPALFRTPTTAAASEITVLWANSAAVSGGASGYDYDFDFRGYDRVLWASNLTDPSPPGGLYVDSDYWQAFMGVSSQWWDFDPAQQATWYLACYPRNVASGDVSGVVNPAVLPDGPVVVSWQRGHWGLS